METGLIEYDEIKAKFKLVVFFYLKKLNSIAKKVMLFFFSKRELFRMEENFQRVRELCTRRWQYGTGRLRKLF
mgnify:CR=1 FL=1